jgi:hypothetical protein
MTHESFAFVCSKGLRPLRVASRTGRGSRGREGHYLHLIPRIASKKKHVHLEAGVNEDTFSITTSPPL